MPPTTPGASAVKTPKYLAIYLADHLAGSVVGYELAKRCAASNRGTDLGRYLEETLIPEVIEDRAALVRVMDLLGTSPSRWKGAAAWLGEKAGRLKLNGEITGYSPLSRLYELEALILGVRGKQCGWEALMASCGSDERLTPIDLAGLAARAERQASELARHHERAAAGALQLPE
jgi:hypothetical protein